MLRAIAGITRIEKVYLQLLYRCDFDCQHCFQGVNLRRPDRFTLEEVGDLLRLLTSEYSAQSVTFLGGEPFLYPQLPDALKVAKTLNLHTSICTNGYRLATDLPRAAPYIDHLRVSIDGTKSVHDSIRKEGSYDEAMVTLLAARRMSLRVSVTMTMTSTNFDELLPLALALAAIGVPELKLHALRPVGNALRHPHLMEITPDMLFRIHSQVRAIRELHLLSVLLDEDLDPTRALAGIGTCTLENELERIEVQPDGSLYVSCKAVGNDSNAFRYDKTQRQVLYEPRARDEVARRVPQVRYSRF